MDGSTAYLIDNQQHGTSSHAVLGTMPLGPAHAQFMDCLTLWRDLQDTIGACYWQSLDQWGDLWRETRGIRGANPFLRD